MVKLIHMLVTDLPAGHQYRAMVTDPALVNTFLGGELDADAMVGVVDPALYRQRC